MDEVKNGIPFHLGDLKEILEMPVQDYQGMPFRYRVFVQFREGEFILFEPFSLFPLLAEYTVIVVFRLNLAPKIDRVFISLRAIAFGA
jgi:hypothetical protein